MQITPQETARTPDRPQKSVRRRLIRAAAFILIALWMFYFPVNALVGFLPRAAARGDLQAVKFWVALGMPIDQYYRDPYNKQYYHGDRGANTSSHKKTALQYAALGNDLDMASFLLQHGADPDLPRKDRHYGPPIAYVGQWRNIEMVRLLLEYGADPMLGPTFSYAKNTGDTGLIRLLVNHGDQPGHTDLQDAGVLLGDLSAIDAETLRLLYRTLVEQECDKYSGIDASCRDTRVLDDVFVALRDVGIVAARREAKQQGAGSLYAILAIHSQAQANRNAISPLHAAVILQEIDGVRLLLSLGLDANELTTDRGLAAPLYYAVSCKAPDWAICELLLEAGSDLNNIVRGNSIWDLAAGSPGAKEFLERYPALRGSKM